MLRGTREAAIMKVLGRTGEASVREFVDKLSQARSIAYTTVMTVIELRRRERPAASPPRRPRLPLPADDHESGVHGASLAAHRRGAGGELGDGAIARFVEVLQRVDPERLAALASVSEQRRAAEK